MADETSQTFQQNPILKRLAAFVGTWQWEASINGQPFGRGRTIWSWLEGGAFLIEHSDAEQPEFPAGTTVVSGDDTLGTYCMLQSDSRGISRIYQMSFDNGVWQQWREAPGFWQRFSGTFSDDGRMISGRSERSEDGAKWEIDFDITYTRLD
ncbi:MAG TPA: hypothetical protein VGD58_26130 [Herpetosiphonaceae bacterium]